MSLACAFWLISSFKDDIFLMFLVVEVSSIKYSSVMNFEIECIVLINCVACHSFWFRSQKSFDCLFSVSFQFFNEKFEIFNSLEWLFFILSIVRSSFWFFLFNRMLIDFKFVSIFMTATDEIRKASRIFLNAAFCSFWSLFRNCFRFFYQISES